MSLHVPSGEDLKNLRKAAGLTQKELARHSKVSQSLISRIEVGTVDPRVSTLKKILNAISSIRKEKNAASVMHRPVITVQSEEPVKKAVNLMEKHGISQLPVLEKNTVVGSIQEGTLIKKIFQSRNPEEIFRTKLRDVMEEAFPTVSPNAGIEEALAAFVREKPAVLVVDKGRLVGIITKMDIIMGIGSSR